jgi:pimeloyl-ACP methyl ester carboxylesterase
VLEILTRLPALHWRRTGAAIREVDVLGCRLWYAEFAPSEREAPSVLGDAARGRSPRKRARGTARRPPPTVVLLHGLGASGASFYPVIGPLRRGYRVIVPDLPGHGWSRPPRGRGHLSFGELLDVAEAFVARISPRGAYLAGNSMGGWIAAKLAARRPDLARGIALLNPGGPALNAEDWVDFGRVFSSEDAASARELLAAIFHRPPLGAQLLSRDLRRLLRAPSVLALVGTLRAEDFLSEEELSQVDCPSVLIWGENDRLIPDGCRSFFLQKLPRVRYEPVPDCGHCPQLECPRRTAEILLELPRMRRESRESRPRVMRESRPRESRPRVMSGVPTESNVRKGFGVPESRPRVMCERA